MPSQYCSSLFPQNRSEFNLSVTKLRDQSGARSDNGMGAGAGTAGLKSIQKEWISWGRKSIQKAFVLLKTSPYRAWLRLL